MSFTESPTVVGYYVQFYACEFAPVVAFKFTVSKNEERVWRVWCYTYICSEGTVRLLTSVLYRHCIHVDFHGMYEPIGHWLILESIKYTAETKIRYKN
jgi:hypothetical protein